MKREIKIYKRLPNGKFEKEVKEEKKSYYKPVGKDKRLGNSHTGLKVVRILDGKIYKSITKCRHENNLCKSTIYAFLEEGTKFKRVN